MKSRFDCPSNSLQLRILLNRTQRGIWIGLGLALIGHIALTQLSGLKEVQKVSKPLTTQFVKRKPRLTKPLEMKKRPQPKRRTIQRKMVSVKARVSRQQLSSRFQPIQTLGRLARPQANVSRIARASTAGLEPEVLAQAVEGTKEVSHQVDMSLEMMDIEALDTGKYHAMVIQDPNDRRNLRGFFHLAPVFIPSVADAEARSNYGSEVGHGSIFPFPSSFRNLVGMLNRRTGVRADVRPAFGINSREVFNVPLIFITSHVRFEISEAEAENLGEYLMAGGFIFSDALTHSARTVHKNMRDLWKQSLSAVGHPYGTAWDFERLPGDHPIYRCYFDFDGPAAAWDNLRASRTAASGTRGPNWVPAVDYLNGITIGPRLLGICTSKNYWCMWSDVPYVNEQMDNSRALEFGVNVIIFALTQEGSITHQVMDSVSY